MPASHDMKCVGSRDSSGIKADTLLSTYHQLTSTLSDLYGAIVI